MDSMIPRGDTHRGSDAWESAGVPIRRMRGWSAAWAAAGAADAAPSRDGAWSLGPEFLEFLEFLEFMEFMAAMILSAWSKKGGPRCGPAVNWHRSIAGASTCRTPRP
jgi:hypothetical protein